MCSLKTPSETNALQSRLERLLHHYFEHSADLMPDAVALESAAGHMTYDQLERRSNQFARTLRCRGVKPETLVGLYLQKSLDLYVAMLGILKAGGGYVPIDPEFPPQRVSQILADANASVVVTEASLANNVDPGLNIARLCVSSIESEIDLQPEARFPTDVEPSNICYVIYTSGSTGLPKGVVLEHRSVSVFVRSMLAQYQVESNDRVLQGFSTAFDASVEEIWAAWAAGATLVVPPTGVNKSPIEIAEFIDEKRVTYFSTIPTFLALVPGDLATVRLLIVGGEACPSTLAQRWVNGRRRMLNTYGPTEASVVTTCFECVPDEPVSIGRPMAGYECWVLDDRMQEIPQGELGELYIAGDSLARGYMGRPDLTSASFIWHQVIPGQPPRRLYRTKDLVRWNSEGMLDFIGRADGQIKIRGFRIELGEIETVLAEHPSVKSAVAVACEKDGVKDIAIYIVPAHDLEVRHRASIAKLLQERLPHYMFPRYLEILQAFPLMTTGKTDRARLPPASNVFVVEDRACVMPDTLLESLIVDVCREHLSIESVSVEADFFSDLKANSLTAAHVVSELRFRLESNQISSRDLYTFRSIRALATQLDERGVKPPKGPETEARTSTVSTAKRPAPAITLGARLRCAALQALSLIVYYFVLTAPVALLVTVCCHAYRGLMSVGTATMVLTICGFAIWPVWLGIGIAVKWIAVGRFKPGSYPIWGSYYFRWWLASRFQTLGWPEMFAGTPLMSLYYRAMGARIGKDCCIGTSYCTAFDLLSIGDRASIGSETHLLGYRVEGDRILFGRIDIADDCFVGMHCALGLNVRMARDARLGDMSLLRDGQIMTAGEQLAGSPAGPSCVDLPSGLSHAGNASRRFIFGALHLLLIYLMGYILLFSCAPGLAAVFAVGDRYGIQAGVLASIVLMPSLFAATMLTTTVLVKRVVIGRVVQGRYSLYSSNYVRYWFTAYLMSNTRQLLLTFYATIFFPFFLRMMGAKIGKGVEISTVMHVTPDLITVEEGSFLADACIVGGHKIYADSVEIRPVTIGRRSFIGNSAFVGGGSNVVEGNLIGAMSVPPPSSRPYSRWLGSPSFEISSAPSACCVEDEAKTYRPGFFSMTGRAAFDIAKIVLPGVMTSAELLVFLVGNALLEARVSVAWAIFTAPILAIALGMVNVLFAAWVKRLLIGTFTSCQQPLWSRFVWSNEIVTGVYETVVTPMLTPLLGTPFISCFLRIMGCKVGRWVFLETALFSEFDLVEIGDFAALNFGSTIQTHLFEDRIMKLDRLVIEEGCTIGNMSVVLYGTRMERGSTLAPLSLLLKGERLPAGSRWFGIPTHPEQLPIEARAVPSTDLASLGFQELSDAEWALIEPLLPLHGRVRRHDDRQMINGIFCRLQTGKSWRSVPAVYGNSATVYSRFRRWAERGIWQDVLEALAKTPRSLLLADKLVDCGPSREPRHKTERRKFACDRARHPRTRTKSKKQKMGRERQRPAA